ncbi:actin-bundling T4SS effector WalE1 family protein [Wolbachia endosymbiont (group A) of Longitarsus flavicornis]|uniref:actin-bundling T4SS effector WalE1 family protein n=1 Tax=Wolbachia endosymbiont (group A) of Longitarsus flavicornis TaxID=3066134 RepID=UPI0030CA1D5D
MLANEQTNSSPIKKNSTFMETVQGKLKNIKDFSNWSAKEQMVAAGAVGAMVSALLPFVAVALPAAAIGAVGALTLFFAYKAVECTFKGLKWSAEKTVDGAKYTAGKVKDASTYAAGKARDGAVHARNSVKEGYEHSVDSLKRGAHLINKRAKEKASNVLTATANKLYRAAGNENYSDRIDNELVSGSPQKEKIQGVKEDFRAIFASGEDNSTLIKSILSGISSKIEEKIAGETYLDFRDGLPNKEVDRWKEQKKFVDNLDASSLHDLVTKRMLDKSKYFRDSVFSGHHDEIKEVIRECKFDQSVRRNNAKDAEERKASKSFSLSSFSSLGRKDSEQSNSLSKNNLLNSVRTESTASSEAELLNPTKHKEVKTPSSFREKMPSRLGGKKAPEETTNVKSPDSSESDTPSRRVGESTFYVAPPKPPHSIGTESTDVVPGLGSDNFATVNPSLLRRSNSSSRLSDGSPQLTPVASPELDFFQNSCMELKIVNCSNQIKP